MRKIVLLASTAAVIAVAAAAAVLRIDAPSRGGTVTVVNGGNALTRYVAALSPTASAPALTPNGECRTASTYNPWGSSPQRIWTPLRKVERSRPDLDIGAIYGEPFSARLVIAYGENVEAFRETAIVEMPDGCRRQFRINSLAPADEAYIKTQMRAHPLREDTATYERQFIDDVTTPERLRNGVIGSYTTQHFAFWYGTKTGSASYRWLRENNTDMTAQLAKTGAFFEKMWLQNQQILNAPMPYADDAKKLKLDIFICGTGLPWYNGDDDVNAGCGASAAESMQSPIMDILPGSDTVTHEMGHMLQFFSGGFRERSGAVWEAGAEWNRFALNPIWPGDSFYYLNNLENGPLFSVVRYGAYPFIMYMREKDDTRDLYWRSWRENLRDDRGMSREDFVEAFVRLGRASGIYPQGYKSFADDVGWYGARLVAMDFLNQRTLIDAHLGRARKSYLSHLYTPLLTVASVKDPTVFASPAQRPLMAYGTHLIKLRPTAAGTVSVTLTGGTQARQAAWRFALVAVGPKDTPYYSPLGRAEGLASGTVSLTPPAGTTLYLAVSATPYIYETVPWQDTGVPIGTRFPYRVKITGAIPRTGSAIPCDPDSVAEVTSNYDTNGFKPGQRQC